MQLLRTLLDDGKEFFPTLTEAVSAMNEAQTIMLKRWIAAGDERALRPLYVKSARVANGAAITGVAAPRACFIYYADVANARRNFASYKDYDVFLNYTDPNFSIGGGMPETAWWTYYNDKLYFHPDSGSYRGELWYVGYPTAFAFPASPTAVAFDFPAEYHPKIVALAAQIINESDVLETERGAIPDPRTRLPIEAFGGT